MPWTASDASKHKKGLSGAQAEQWAAVANDVLAKTGDEGQAIRAANGVVGRSKHREAMTREELENWSVADAIREELGR